MQAPSIVLGVIIGLSLSTPASGGLQAEQQSLAPKEIYNKYVDSIVHIDVKAANGDERTGTGFFIDDGKHLATCFHIIKDGTQIQVRGTKSANWTVASVRWDEKMDLAVLELEKDTARAVCPCSDLVGIGPGDEVSVLGNPLGVYENTLSVGIVSSIRHDPDMDFVQFTAPISAGSSGSPVFDSKGKVICVADATATEGQNLNLGVPATRLKSLPYTLTWSAFAAKSNAAEAKKSGTPKTKSPTRAELQFLDKFANWQSDIKISKLRWDLAMRLAEDNEDWKLLESAYKGFAQYVDDGMDAFIAAAPLIPTARFSDLALQASALKHAANGLQLQQALLIMDAHFHQSREKFQQDADSWDAADKKFRHALSGMLSFYQNEPWFSWDRFQKSVHNPIGVVLLWGADTLDAYPDPDISDCAYLGKPWRGSNFELGDQIVAVAVSPAEPFTPVKTWRDYALFTDAHHDIKRFYVHVLRGTLYFDFYTKPEPKS